MPLGKDRLGGIGVQKKALVKYTNLVMPLAGGRSGRDGA